MQLFFYLSTSGWFVCASVDSFETLSAYDDALEAWEAAHWNEGGV